MKVSIIGAGNVGGLSAMRLAQEAIGDIVLVDIAKGLAQGKAFDCEDARAILKQGYHIAGTDDINQIKNSDIIVVTAGLARKPGMTREGLLAKNSQTLKAVCLKIKELASESILIVVTNPLDIMTYLALKVTNFSPSKVLGMGLTLDAARFSNQISHELKVSPVDIESCVIGAHGAAMLPLSRFTNIKGVPLEQFLDQMRIKQLRDKTINRGKEIVTLLGSGSAYFAPSAAIASIVKIIAGDQKRTQGVCAYLDGEYGLKDICIGVPCRLGRKGIEEIIELDLIKEEKEALKEAADSLRQQYKHLPL